MGSNEGGERCPGRAPLAGGECPCTHRRAPARGPENQHKCRPRDLSGDCCVEEKAPDASLPAAAPRPPHARRITVPCNDSTCHGPTAPVAMHWQASPGTAAIEHLSGPSKTAFPWRAESESELGIQRGIHLAFNGHSMGQIWHSGLFGSVEPYCSWIGADQFPGGNFLIIILEGAKEHRLPRMGCTHGPGSRSLPEFHGPRRARDF